MTKNKLNIALGAALAVSTLVLAGCSDDFLREKRNYANVSVEVYETYEGAKLRTENLYWRLKPNSRGDVEWNNPSRGTTGDNETKATEEFAGFTDYTDPDKKITAPFFDRFFVKRETSNGPFGQIRNCNDIIEGIQGSSALTDGQKRELLGQAYFFRAWIYFLLVRTYGGVPIIDRVQVADVGDAKDLSTPRATTKECIDFICKDLDLAAEMLASHGPKEYGRVTAATALAVKGRLLLLYASPLFNRTGGAVGNPARWQAAYNANKAALEQAHMQGLGLHNEDNPGVNGSGWSHMFSEYKSDEAVFVTLHNDNWDDNAAIETYYNNPREQSMRPYNTLGNAGEGVSATANMIDLFPMADGGRPGTSGLAYIPVVTWAGDNATAGTQPNFWENRDPRFYRTFAFPGVRWRFNDSPLSWTYAGGIPQRVRYNGGDYALWNYVWYKAEQTDDVGGFSSDGLNDKYKGVYVRKRSNDFDLAPMSGMALYKVHYQSGQASFASNAAPHMEIRYTEVLLNYAEAAVGIGELDEAFEILKRIRKRAGYDVTIAGADYGLKNGSQAEMFRAVLYERQIELAYEGKRFEDMRRWMLWDGGEQLPPDAPRSGNGSWRMEAFGGSTIIYLGEDYFNGKRRDHIELRVKESGVGVKQPLPFEESNDRDNTKDPFYSTTSRTVERPAPLDLKIPFSEQQVVIDNLKKFYTDNLEIRVRRGDRKGGTNSQVINFQPHYYFMGLNSGAQNNNQSLLQTIGWEDTRAHGEYFNPLAE